MLTKKSLGKIQFDSENAPIYAFFDRPWVEIIIFNEKIDQNENFLQKIENF